MGPAFSLRLYIRRGVKKREFSLLGDVQSIPGRAGLYTGRVAQEKRSLIN